MVVDDSARLVFEVDLPAVAGLSDQLPELGSRGSGRQGYHREEEMGLLLAVGRGARHDVNGQALDPSRPAGARRPPWLVVDD